MLKLSQPFIIAEMSGNHNQSLDRALEIVDTAAAIGVNALKLQTYTADTITLNSNNSSFKIEDKKSLWSGKNLHQLYQEAYTPWEWHKAIFDRCKEKGIIAFSSPFDETSVDFLESLNVPLYKIASFENTHLPLIKKVAQTKKPLIVSTGMASIDEINDIVSTATKNGCPQLILLKCTSTYPASPKNTNLLTIPDMQQRFNVEIGLSDHTLGIGVAVASIALGVRVIEKHFTLSRNDGGVDASFSMEPQEMKQLATECYTAFEALGEITYSGTKDEQKSKQFKRSIFACKDIKKGEAITSDNIKIVRPGNGLKPKFFDHIIGKKAAKSIPFATPINWDLIDETL